MTASTNSVRLLLPALVFFFATEMMSCHAYQDYKVADNAVTNFHAHLDAEEYAEIYAASDPEFKKVTTEAEFRAILEAIHRKLGKVKASSSTGVNVNWDTSEGTLVHQSYATTFEEGKATERFVWRPKGSDVLLYGYNIQSNTLIIK